MEMEFVCDRRADDVLYLICLYPVPGKSTLLNTLACRLDVNTAVTGQLRLNGRPYKSTELKKMSGYVMQDDLLNPNLTVRETLHYTAALRLPATFNSDQRDVRVNEVIREMGLLQCQDVIVGDPSKKGISGGERRRVCIGMELLTRPTLLFLDEPTSGLDSVTALALMQLLQRITRSGKCSMLVSIHQPQAKLFALFDRLLLLKSGRILFQGSVPAALQLFESAGFPVPHYSNPADHILDVITPPMDQTVYEQTLKDAALEAERQRRRGVLGQASFDIELAVAVAEDQASPQVDGLQEDPRLGDSTPLGKALNQRRKLSLTRAAELEQQSIRLPQRPDQANEEMLLSKFEQPIIDLGFGSSKPLILERENLSWIRQTRILMERNVKETLRKKTAMMIAIIQTIIMAVLIGTVFLRIGNGQSSTVRRQPVLFFVCINQGMFGALAVINSFPAERALMLRERAAGTYYASAYFIAKTTVDTLMTLHLPIIFSVIVYFLVGFQEVGSKFIIFLIFMILTNIAATSLALMVSALCKTTDLSVTILPMVLEACRLFGAFFLSPKNTPKWFSWLDAVSYVQYCYIGVSLNELDGLKLHCTEAQITANGGTCPYTNGQQFIDSLGLDYISLGGCVAVLCGYIAVCRVIAYLAIRYMKTN